MTILLGLAFVLPAVLYSIGWWLAVRGSGEGPRAQVAASRMQLAGLAAHLLSLHLALFHDDGLYFGFAPILSAVLWVGVTLLWFEGLRAHVQALRVLILPVAAIASLLPWAFPGGTMGGEGGPMFVPHVLVGTLAYSVLFLAAVHAGLMAAAERALHGRPDARPSMFARLLDDLPPLLVLERLLFQFIAVGFALLSLTLISGFLFSEEIFGRAFRLEHKTLFAVIAWCVFGVLLLGRYFRGWRGRIALRLTLGGFVVLLLAYVGTRFVLEVLLGRI